MAHRPPVAKVIVTLPTGGTPVSLQTFTDLCYTTIIPYHTAVSPPGVRSPVLYTIIPYHTAVSPPGVRSPVLYIIIPYHTAVSPPGVRSPVGIPCGEG